jgi:hypothetical protein
VNPIARVPVAFVARLLALLALTAAVGVVYQSVENFIPYWDYARIERLFHALDEAFDGGVWPGITWLVDQVNHVEYNSVFALPLMVAADLVGSSRDRIVLATLLVHAALYLIAFSFLLRTVLGARSLDEIGVLQLGSALLLPSVFTATMLGFETIAVLPVLTVGLTVLLVASWPDRPRSLGGRLALFFLAGALLAATFLIRRAYAYTVISVFSTAGLVLVGEMVLGRLDWRSRESRIRISGLVAAGGGSLAVLLGFARERVLAVLATPYHELYAAWKITPAEAFRQLLSSVGGVVLVAAAAGYLLGRSVLDPGRRVMAALLGLAGGLGFLQWFFLVRLRMRLDKPMLYAPMIALGFALLFAERGKRWWSVAARAVCLVLLLVNLAVSLGALPSIRSARRVVFADALPPLTRPDMDEFRDFITWLREHTVDERGRGGEILVLAATGDLNDSLVKEAEVRFFGWGNELLNVPHFNSVDRTSNYPVWLHNADWVVVARPFQFHTSLEERRLLRFAWEEMVHRRGVAENFKKLNPVWSLGRRANRPIKVRVWQRVRPDTPAQLLDLIGRSKEYVIHHPVFPDLWVGMGEGGSFRSSRAKRDGEHYTLRFRLYGRRRAETTALFVEPLEPGVTARMRVAVTEGDPGAANLVAELLDERDLRRGTTTVVESHPVALTAGGAGTIEVRAPAPDRTLLRLRAGRSSKPVVGLRARVEIVGQSR